MTIARDIRTGEIRGQVIGTVGPPVDFYTGEPDPHYTPHICLLGRNGSVIVPRSSVRLEEISDR